MKNITNRPAGCPITLSLNRFFTSVFIKNDLVKFLLNLNIVVSPEEKTKEKGREEVVESKSDKKVGRNEKCPCGSGKKFKHCHGNV